MGTAATKSKSKYRAKNYKQVVLCFKPDDLEILEEIWQLAGYENRSQFIFEAINEKIQKIQINGTKRSTEI